MAEFQPGDLLADRFEVVGTLGRGGMATVYLAQDRAGDDRVALKVLHPHLARDPSMRRRLHREIAAARLVDHSAALVAQELHEVRDTLALSMPFHAGTTLTERVRSQGPLDEAQVRQLGVRVASALADAHRCGVLHRDVTPNNVMLQAADDAVLTDFGLAHTQDGTATATSVMGTPGYAAPEVYQGQRTDPRSDLYSLGAVLYFAATGRSPFGVGAPAAILHNQLTGEPESLEGLAPDLIATIESLLDRNPDRRPPSAQEVARALQAGRSAIVPEVPDTWNPADEPLLPKPARSAAVVPAPAPLPAGSWEVEVRGRKGCDARSLADNVGAVAELPPGSLEITRPMRTRRKKFILTRATDRDTARQLADAARTAGYRARVFDSSPPNPLQWLMGLAPMLIPLIWIAFPFYTLPTFGLELALLGSIGATILIPSLTAPFTKRRADADLPLAFGSDLSRHLVGAEPASEGDLDTFIDTLGLPDFLRDIAHEVAADDDIRGFADKIRKGFQTPATRVAQPSPQPALEPAPEPEPSRAEALRGRALGHLDLLMASVADLPDLPDLARDDLRRTATALRERAVELSRNAVALEAALEATPEPADVSWIHGRLTRLETLERAGESADPDERERLLAALQSAESTESARTEIESTLTSTLTQLLEIGATAARARADVLAQADVPSTARDLTKQLDQQVKAVDATRRELSRRRAAQPWRRER